MWSNSSRCWIVSIYLSQTWCLYTWSCLDNLIIIRFSINCSTVICSPTIILMLSWEKPLVKPMPPGSILHHTSFQSILFCNLYFPIYTKKIPKYLSYYLYQISLLQVAMKGLTTPLSRWLLGSWLFVHVLGDLHVVSYWIDTLVLKNWGKYLRYFVASPFPLQGKTNAVLKR